ncbi:MAG: hypothetical protein PHV13_02385 [Candidatus ainarchaeum sp.]|nr:hypothetical protein [Candidatus ainarchaeum sp.]
MATTQAFPGSKTHLELCRKNFTSQVLPHLQPRVRDLFQGHFADSYDLIRALSREPGEFHLHIALSAIGIRGFDLVEPQAAGLLMRNADRLNALGMGCRPLRSGHIEVFTQELVGPMLVSILGMREDFRNVKADLEQFAALDRKKHPYDLLIWSSFIPPGKYAEFAVLDIVIPLDKRYHLGCLVPKNLDALAITFTRVVTAGLELVQQICGNASGNVLAALRS